MIQSQLQELKEAINFLKKGYNDLASENVQLKIDLINALDNFKSSGFNELFKKVLEREAKYKEQTAIILNQTVQNQLKILDKIDNLSLKIKKLEEKQ
tara:strand:+ start:148 stop:438 length:291 start_codon:yes stop_codon:yes gene_type:complete